MAKTRESIPGTYVKNVKLFPNGARTSERKMKLTFLGVSGLLDDGFSSNMLLDIGDNTLLIDCGLDIKHSLAASNRKVEEIDAIYISHLHSDHMGGLEYFAYYSKFISSKKIKLYIHESQVFKLWSMLAPSLCIMNNKHSFFSLDDYFDVYSIYKQFHWNMYTFELEKLNHIENGIENMYSYGISCVGSLYPQFYISTDTKECKAGFGKYIFHDCDVMNLGGAHANYEDLVKDIHPNFKKDMWLYHYHDLGDAMPNAKADGFAGFVKQGQIFEIED